MASVIYRGIRFDFDESIGSCGGTEGHNYKCPICVPERFTEAGRLLTWLNDQSESDPAAWHVYRMARSWLDPETPTQTARQKWILADLASGDPERIQPHLSTEWRTWIIDEQLIAREVLTAEATRARLDA